MIKRIVEISTDGHYLSVKNDQLIIHRDRQEIASIPCEDLGLLILDSKATVYTHDAIVRAVSHGAVVVLCGGDHHPAAMLLSTTGNELQTKRLRAQAAARKPQLKQMWQQVVRAKIRNQASVLPEDHRSRTAMVALPRQVRSGDPANVEARAARRYWPALFDDAKFRRRREGSPPNNLLNYGYMALRAATARAICGAGLHPSLGIAHHNQYNAFCLADDLMEPYRPYVDAKVVELWTAGHTTIDAESKRVLLSTLTDPVQVGETTGPLMVALHRTATSLVNVLSGDVKKLALPER